MKINIKKLPILLCSFVLISCNTSQEENIKVDDKIFSKLQKYTIVECPNKGMDIGGFLTVLNMWKNTGKTFDYVFKLHTKTNDIWRSRTIF